MSPELRTTATVPIRRLSIVAAVCVLALTSALRAQPACTVSGPDSIRFDKITYNRYLPGTFSVSVLVTNPGTAEADSVVVFPRSNPRFTIISQASLLAADTLLPGDSVHVSFTLSVNPRESSGIDTLVIAISAKAGMRSVCRLPIWVEREYRPVNALLCPTDTLRVAFVDSLDAYRPDPITVPLTVINQGDAPSTDTRLFYVATPGVTPAPGQDAILPLGTLQPGERADHFIRLSAVRRTTDTVVTLHFRVQGTGGLGDRIIDTLCASVLVVPAARDAVFALDCRNDVTITAMNGVYAPNPFDWKVTVRNTGTARAHDVRAVLVLPPSITPDTGQAAEFDLGSLDPGASSQVQWRLRALPVAFTDTVAVCVRVYDAFNRTATCCDSVILPAVKIPALETSCLVVPDSIFADPISGAYLPSSFTARVRVGNIGSAAADSVYADLVLSDPGVAPITPTSLTQLVSLVLAPGASADAVWTLAPLPDPQPRTVQILFHVRSGNAGDQTVTCAVHIAAVPVPVLECTAVIDPADTLHVNRETLEYQPLRIDARVRNTGHAAASHLEATVLMPPGIGLAAGDSAVRKSSLPLATGGAWDVSWTLQPLVRREGRLDTVRVEFRADGQRTSCFDRIFIVGIPPVTVLAIPTGQVQKHDRSVRVPVSIDNTTGKDIRRLDVAVRWDPSLLDFTGFDLEGALLEHGWSFAPASSSGRAAFSASRTDSSLRGQGDLAYMNFRVRFGLGNDVMKYAWADLLFDTLACSVNAGGILVRYYHGLVLVSGDCLEPLLAGANYAMIAKPNPFNPSTLIEFELLQCAQARIRVFNALGQPVAELANGMLQQGAHAFRFDATTLPSGVYLCVLETPMQRRTLKLLLAR